MEKLLMLGTNAGTCEILEAAKKRGIYTIVADYNQVEHSYGKQLSDESWDCNTSDIDTLEIKCRAEGVTCVMCGASDFNTKQVIRLCERLNLPCYLDEETWRYSIDKKAFKQACISEGVPVPELYEIDENTDLDSAEIKFPVVVKPNDQSGSIGVKFCYNKDELRTACKEARRLSRSNSIVVERMLRGREFVAQYAFAEGEGSLYLFNTMNYYAGVEGLYTIETTATSYLDRYIKTCSDKVLRALKRCGCKENVAWVQVFLDEDGKFYLIEMGHRQDGTLIVVPYADVSGFNSLNWSIDCALGIKHECSQLPRISQSLEKCATVYYLRAKKDGVLSNIRIDDTCRHIHFMWQAYKGDHLSKYSTICVALFHSDSISEMIETIDNINNKVVLEDMSKENLLQKFTQFNELLGN